MTQAGKLRINGKLSEAGFTIANFVEKVFESDKLAQQNHANMLCFLYDFGMNVIDQQKVFQQKIIDCNDRRTELLREYMQDVNKQLNQAQEKFDAHMEKIMDKILDIDDPTDNQIKQLEIATAVQSKYFEGMQLMTTNAQNACSQALAANKIDESIINETIKARANVMMDLFKTIRETGKQQATVTESAFKAMEKLIDKVGASQNAITDNNSVTNQVGVFDQPKLIEDNPETKKQINDYNLKH